MIAIAELLTIAKTYATDSPLLAVKWLGHLKHFDLGQRKSEIGSEFLLKDELILCHGEAGIKKCSPFQVLPERNSRIRSKMRLN
jgi:hypothetical protein